MRDRLVAPLCSMLETQPSPTSGHWSLKNTITAVDRIPTVVLPSWTRSTPCHTRTTMPIPPSAVTAGHRAPVAQADRDWAILKPLDSTDIESWNVSSRPYPFTTWIPAKASREKVDMPEIFSWICAYALCISIMPRLAMKGMSASGRKAQTANRQSRQSR